MLVIELPSKNLLFENVTQDFATSRIFRLQNLHRTSRYIAATSARPLEAKISEKCDTWCQTKVRTKDLSFYSRNFLRQVVKDSPFTFSTLQQNEPFPVQTTLLTLPTIPSIRIRILGMCNVNYNAQAKQSFCPNKALIFSIYFKYQISLNLSLPSRTSRISSTSSTNMPVTTIILAILVKVFHPFDVKNTITRSIIESKCIEISILISILISINILITINQLYANVSQRAKKFNNPPLRELALPLFVNKQFEASITSITHQKISPNNFRKFRTHQRHPTARLERSARLKRSTEIERDRWRRLLLLQHGDVERNPGPRLTGNTGENNSDTRIISNNVRGLNDRLKLRHLINYLIKDMNRHQNLIACLQETYIENHRILQYLWRGNYYITPGTGNSCGCITLLSYHLNVVEARNLGDRGHVLAVQRIGSQNVTHIIANIYAPNPNTNDKIEFFNNAFEMILELCETHACEHIIMAGDFNLILKEIEGKNRNFSAQEKRIAAYLSANIGTLGLQDIWELRTEYTWRRPNTDSMSTIDRILVSKESFKVNMIKTDWSLSMSDHAAVIIDVKTENLISKRKLNIPRLDATILNNEESKNNIFNNVQHLMEQIPTHWNPHQILEFCKMSIRTVAEQEQARVKKNEKSMEEFLNDELNVAIKSLNDNDNNTQSIIEHIEKLRIEKSVMIEERGKRLAEKLGSKWYNEGEKSTRYFLRLLNRKNPDEFSELKSSEGNVLTSENDIEQEIVNFYKSLYENYRTDNLQDDDATFYDRLEKLNANEEESVVQSISNNELEATLRSCKDSAPGPDGIPYSFLRLLWPIIGEIIIKAWNYSLETGELCVSHKLSFLKLIPKAGKDQSLLTNWRPITLSNCDHKIITKTYANRLGKTAARLISDSQTAYLNGRMISDNIRALITSIITGEKDEIDELIISLDAKKAFDSVEHTYIEKCLEKIGLKKFIPIFRILYSDLSSDILINGKVVKGFRIKRGVKQGDALSCILFIICIEPLLRNIEANEQITRIKKRTEPLVEEVELPVAYAYADDVSGCIGDDQRSLQAIFNEYERLTRQSGLELNADKTELLRINKSGIFQRKEYEVMYLGNRYKIKNSERIKINGIILQRNYAEMVDTNVDASIAKLQKHLSSWTRRQLSTLGKILILKTYAISQIIHVMQSLVLSNSHYKRINHFLYKFIWNRHYQGAKAPERIARSIVNKPIKEGGLGMLDIAKLDEGLKLKNLGRLINSNHPMQKILRGRINNINFFEPALTLNIDPYLEKAIDLLIIDRAKLHLDEKLKSNKLYIEIILNQRLMNVISENGRLSLAVRFVWNSGVRKIRDLSVQQLNTLERFIMPTMLPHLRYVIENNLSRLNPETNPNTLDVFFFRGKTKLYSVSTSKYIRQTRDEVDPVCIYKIGLILQPSDTWNWMQQVNKIKSTRFKSNLLNAIHGAVYYGEKLFRYGLIDNPQCPRCDQIETLEHKLITCPYSRKIWKETINRTKILSPEIVEEEDEVKRAFASVKGVCPTTLTIHSAVLTRIIHLKREQNYLLHPKYLVISEINRLIKLERQMSTKQDLNALLE